MLAEVSILTIIQLSWRPLSSEKRSITADYGSLWWIVKCGGLDTIVLRAVRMCGKSTTMNIDIEVYTIFRRIEYRMKSLISIRILRSKMSSEEIDGYVWPKRCVILRANRCNRQKYYDEWQHRELGYISKFQSSHICRSWVFRGAFRIRRCRIWRNDIVYINGAKATVTEYVGRTSVAIAQSSTSDRSIGPTLKEDISSEWEDVFYRKRWHRIFIRIFKLD